MRFDLLRRKAESNMQMRGGSPGSTCVGALYAKRLPLLARDIARTGLRTGNSGIPAAARQMRQLVRPRGGGCLGGDKRQDVLAATDVDASSDNDDFTAWVAYRIAKKRKWGKDEDGGAKEKTGQAQVGGQIPNGRNRKTGRRNRCDWRKTEHHFVPQ